MKTALFGYGGHAREVAMQIGGEITFFVDDAYVNDIAKPISEFDPLEYEIMVAIADPQEREKVVSRLPRFTQFFTFIHPTAIISQNFDVVIGEGSFIGANSIIGANVCITKSVPENSIVTVQHENNITQKNT